MSDHQPPLNAKEGVLAATLSDVAGLERSLNDLAEASRSNKLRQTDGLGAVARISRYSESIFKVLGQLDKDQAVQIRERVSRVWVEIDRLLSQFQTSFSQLLEESRRILSGQPVQDEESIGRLRIKTADKDGEHNDNPESDWQDTLKILKEKAHDLLIAMRDLQQQIEDHLIDRPNISSQELSQIIKLLGQASSLAGAYQAAGLRHPDQTNLFASSWQQIHLLLSVYETNLDRLYRLPVADGEQPSNKQADANQPKEKPPAQENWPPDFMELPRQFLDLAQPEHIRLKSLLDGITILRPSEAAEAGIRDQANTFIADFQRQKAQLSSDVVTLERWARIVQADSSISPMQRLKREDEVNALKTELQDHIQTMEKFEELVWEKSLLFISPEAKLLFEAVGSYREPTPATVNMAGYGSLRAGVTDLMSQIEAVRASEARLCRGSSGKQTFLRSWLDNFSQELERRRLSAFVFWRDHLQNMHASFDPATAGSMAERLQTARGVVDLTLLDSRELKTRRSELEAALKKSKGEIVAAVTVKQLPSETEEDRYQTHLKTVWAEVDQEIERWDKAIQQKEAYDYINGIDAQLKAIENTLLVISIDDNQVKDKFDAIRAEFSEKVEQNTLLPEKDKRELEIRITQAEYKHVRSAYIERIEFVEGKNLGLSLSLEQFGKVMDVRLIPKLKQLTSELVRLSQPPGSAALTEQGRYADDLKDIVEDYRCRKYAHIAWARVWSNVIGNNESQGREPPTGLSDDNFPLDGTVISGLIKHGVLSREFGGGLTGAALGKRRILTENIDTPGQIDVDDNFQQSLFGLCMRTFDDVYRGKESCPGVTTRNIHTTYGLLVTHTYEKAKKEYQRKHAGRRVPFEEHDVLLAWRLHSISTLNISYLAEASPTMPDNFYYLFNWVDYCIKYAFDQTNSFDPMQTLFVFGYGGANPLSFIYSPEQMADVREKLSSRGWMGGTVDKARAEAEHLWQLEGYTGFDALINAPLIRLENVAHDGSVKAPMFEPPLRAWVVRDRAGGNPKRYENGNGKIMRFDDMQTTSGERLYEQMPFDQIGMAYPEYYNQIGKNAMWMLTNVFKCSSEDFLKKMSSADFVKTLRNQVKYAMPYFTRVGADIREGTKRKRKNTAGVDVVQPISETIMNSVVNQLIMAKCIMETDVLKPKFWSINQVEDYLQDLVRSSAIIPEVAEAIKLVVIEGRKWQMRQMDLLHKLQTQVESAAKMK